MPDTASVAIIGGGIVGASIAHYLAQMGQKDVVLLEKDTIASGATGSSGALVRMHYSNPWDTALALKSLEVFDSWAEIIGGDSGFRKTGFVAVVDRDNAGKLRNNVEMQRRVGVNTRVISPEDVKELQPFSNVDDLGAAAYEPDSGYADGYSAATSMARRARELGVEIRQGVTVRPIRSEGDRITGLRTSDGDIDAPVVVLAAGAWSAVLASSAGIDLPMGAQRLTAGMVERPEEIKESHMVFIDHAVGQYFRPDVGALTLLGIRPGPSVDSHVDPDSYDGAVALAWQARALAQLAHRVPAMAEAGWRRSWAQVDGYTSDGHMVLGQTASLDGLYVAAGMSGSGFKTGPAVGMCIAELILEGQSRAADIEPFRLTRFEENNPIVSDDDYEIPEFVVPSASP
ncbi:MAG: hypothetical protein CL694_05830 [Chloroflexi bacterium]|nr:hypothetical protein [Chloroflexota bacterium]|tara:strand:- start:134 stop:1336 length:1203 start_codon:yes stop_codon:yes gene_type:complete